MTSQRSGQRTVVLGDGHRSPISKSIAFVWMPEVRAWISPPFGAARRTVGGKWFARWLLVRGDDLSGGVLELRTEVMGTAATIERWLETVPEAARAQLDLDWTPTPWGVQQRERALGAYAKGQGRSAPLDASCGYPDLLARETALHQTLPPSHDHDSTQAGLWRRAVAAGRATPAEEQIAYQISDIMRPGMWNYAGD